MASQNIIINKRFAMDYKNVTEDEAFFLNLISKRAKSKTRIELFKEVLKLAMKVENYSPYHRKEDEEKSTQLIDDAVKKQHEINSSQDQRIVLGSGKNRIEVIPDYREITPEWILANVTPKPPLNVIHRYVSENKGLIKSKTHYDTHQPVPLNFEYNSKIFLDKIDAVAVDCEFTDVEMIDIKQWLELRRTLDNGTNGLEKSIKEKEKNLGVIKTKVITQIEKICVDELCFLFKNHKLSTVLKTDVPAYRKLIKEKGKNHPALLFFNVSSTVHDRIKDSYKKKVKARSGEREFDDFDYIPTAINLLDSSKYYEIVIGLCALTGRRPTEIIKTAKFSSTNQNNIKVIAQDWHSVIQLQDCVAFRGQLKTKNNVRTEQDEYTIPVLCEPNKIMNALKKLRQINDFSHKTTKEINSSTAKGLSRTVKKIFNDSFQGGVKMYDLRHAYALLCAQKYCDNPSQWSKFISTILGHNDTDIETVMSYMSLKLK